MIFRVSIYFVFRVYSNLCCTFEFIPLAVPTTCDNQYDDKIPLRQNTILKQYFPNVLQYILQIHLSNLAWFIQDNLTKPSFT